MTKQKTLSDYILFLRKNGKHQEAYYYSTEVVRVLSLFLQKTEQEILNMPSDSIMENLENISSTLSNTLSNINQNKDWDVELVSNE